MWERTVSFRTRKVFAMFVYLVVDRGMHSRDELMALLWPESAPASAASTLRVSLSRLRRALQPEGEVLITEAGKVAFNPDTAVNLDLDWLSAAVDEKTPPESLRPILGLDRGEFLEGFSLPDAPAFEHWAAARRAAYLRQVESVYSRFSQHMLAIHNSPVAVETAARWISRAPLSEEAHRRLMAAQVLNGQRPAALITYQALQDSLQKELGVEPSRETVALAKSIESGRVTAEYSGPTVAEGRPTSADLRKRLALPLSGRFDEHRQLVDAFHKSGQDWARIVVLIGAAGVGKTRLLSTFQDWVLLNAPKSEFWQGQAYETGGRLAYQPVVEALRLRLDRVNAPEDMLEDVWLAELSQLMPELRARYPDLPMPMSGDANFVRARLFESLAALGNALAAGRPSVLVLDDMQWADPDTLDLVHYLARRWAEMQVPVLLLLAVRQEAYAADTRLREWLARLERDLSVDRLLLGSLNGAAVNELVGRLAGEGSDQGANSAFAAWLWAETRGLPFFIEALLQMLVEQEVLKTGLPVTSGYNFTMALEHVRSIAKVSLPPGVREVIRARMKKHSREADALLLAAAVMGRSCTFERICQIADLPEMEALEHLEALLDGRLIAEQPLDRRPYSLAHDYIREVVYSESKEARRRVYHRRALLALESQGASAAECAYHALASQLDEPAFRFSVAAGSESFSSNALKDALSHFDTAREVARRMQDSEEDADLVLLERLYQQRGRVLELSRDDETAQANYEEMRKTAVKQRSITLELSALIAQSHLHGHYTGVFNPLKAKQLGQEALGLARQLGDKTAEAGALWGLMVAVLYSAGDSSQVIAYGDQALVLARQLNLKELTGRILGSLCWPYFARNEIAYALETLVEAKSIWQGVGDLTQLAEASKTMVFIREAVGDYRGVLAGAPELADLASSIGDQHSEGSAYLMLSIAHARQGRFGLALENLKKVWAYVEPVEYPNEIHTHQWARIKCYLAAGAFEEAERWADDLLVQRATIPPNFIPLYITEAALAKIARGSLVEGHAILDEVLAGLVSEAPWSYAILPIAVGYGQIHLALGRPEMVFTALEERIEPFRKAGYTRLLADEHWLRGRAALALGQHDRARHHLEKARDAAEAQDERTVLWPILFALSQVEEATSRPAAAEKLRKQAKAVIQDIAAHAGELREVFLAQPEVAYLLKEG